MAGADDNVKTPSTRSRSTRSRRKAVVISEGDAAADGEDQPSVPPSTPAAAAVPGISPVARGTRSARKRKAVAEAAKADEATEEPKEADEVASGGAPDEKKAPARRTAPASARKKNAPSGRADGGEGAAACDGGDTDPSPVTTRSGRRRKAAEIAAKVATPKAAEKEAPGEGSDEGKDAKVEEDADAVVEEPKEPEQDKNPKGKSAKKGMKTPRKKSEGEPVVKERAGDDEAADATDEQPAEAAGSEAKKGQKKGGKQRVEAVDAEADDMEIEKNADGVVEEPKEAEQSKGPKGKPAKKGTKTPRKKSRDEKESACDATAAAATEEQPAEAAGSEAKKGQQKGDKKQQGGDAAADSDDAGIKEDADRVVEEPKERGQSKDPKGKPAKKGTKTPRKKSEDEPVEKERADDAEAAAATDEQPAKVASPKGKKRQKKGKKERDGDAAAEADDAGIKEDADADAVAVDTKEAHQSKGPKGKSAKKRSKAPRKKSEDEPVNKENSGEAEAADATDELSTEIASPKGKKRRKRGRRGKKKRDGDADAGARKSAPSKVAAAPPKRPTPTAVAGQPPPVDAGTNKNAPSIAKVVQAPPKRPTPTATAGQSPPPKQMDVSVHRVRHLDYIPRGIVRLASTPPHYQHPTPSSSSSSEGRSEFSSSYIAVARDGGAVDLLAVDEKWRCVASVPGLKKRDVDALAWVCGRGCVGSGGGSEEMNEGSTMSELDGGPSALTRGGSTYSCEEHQQSARVHSRRRLFGASRDGTVFELDFRTQRHAHVTGSGGGGVFCLASLCPRCSGPEGQCGGYLAAGCEDGSVRIYRLGPSVDEGESAPLELVSTLPSAGQAVLSLAWQQGNAAEDGIGGSVLYAGIADATIRRYDCVSSIALARASGSAAHAISTGSVLVTPSSSHRPSQGYQWKATNRMTVETLGRRTPTRIWALEALSDGTVVSGDSLGHIQFWDGISGTLMSKFVQNENRADVLDIAVSENECKVFASGVDSRVVCIERAPQPSSKQDATGHPTASKWVQTQAQRPHTHDVKGLCICHMKDPLGAGGAKASSSDEGRELLCSGGVDTKLCTYLVSKFRQHRAKKVYPWPSLSPVAMARGPRILSLMRSDKIDLYQLGPTADVASTSTPLIMDEDKSHLGSIEISSLYNLMCADISDDGKLLAASDAAGLLLFSLAYEEDETDEAKRKLAVPTKLNLLGEARLPCTAVKFAPGSSGRLFCATTSGPINVLKVEGEGLNTEDHTIEDEPSAKVLVEHTFKEHVTVCTDSRPYPITELAVSPDARWLAAGRFAMGSNAIHVFELQATELASYSRSSQQPERRHYRHWWSVPAMEAPHSCIKFLGGGEVGSALAVGCSNNCFYIFDIDRRCLSDWSQDAGFPISSSLPRELIHRAEYPVRLAFNVACPDKFLLGAHGFFCIIDLDLPVPKHSNIFPPNHVRARRFVPKKRRSGSISEEGAGADADGSSLPLTRKRKRTLSNADSEAGRHANNFTICLRYSGMLFMDFLADNEMVVVEQPWMNVVNALPDALERRVYGS